MTVLFTDLVGSTARAEGLDPEDVRATLSPYYARLRAELERHGGTVEKFIGDAVMAVFGAPVAHEDDPERAVRAALAIRDRHRRRARRSAPPSTPARRSSRSARSPARATAMVAGDVVNTAARLQSAAPVNGILVGEATYRATRHAIDYREAAPVEAKGKAEPVTVWEAVAARARFGSRRRAAAAHAARRPRARARPARRRARARRSEQSAQLVTLVGVPGIGKSRLVAELFQVVDADPELIWWRQGRSLPYGEGVSFWALGEIVKAQAGILETDDAATARGEARRDASRRSADGRARAGSARTPSRPLVGSSRTTPERDRARRGVRRLAPAARGAGRAAAARARLRGSPLGRRRAARLRRPPRRLGDRRAAADRRHGAAGAARPPARLGRRQAERARRSRSAPLSDDETAAAARSGCSTAPARRPRSRQAVLAARRGQPALRRGVRAGCSPSTAAGGELPLPETVQGMIAARLDALAPAEKELLQDASVIGKVFWPGALARRADELERPARARAQGVRPARPPLGVAGETQYAFLHALVRDVAYGQIPRARARREAPPGG